MDILVSRRHHVIISMNADLYVGFTTLRKFQHGSDMGNPVERRCHPGGSIVQIWIIWLNAGVTLMAALSKYG